MKPVVLALALVVGSMSFDLAYAIGPVPKADNGADCDNAQTQSEMNACASDDFDRADKALNAQWKLTRKAMVDMDANLEADQKGAEKALLKGQRAWIEYRDGQCEAEGFSVRGGTMEPMMVDSCKAHLTDLRTKELKALAEQQ